MNLSDYSVRRLGDIADRPGQEPDPREIRILEIASRKARRGVSVDEQYATLNAARDKRARRRDRNLRNMAAGGFGATA